MTMTKQPEQLPQPEAELERLAEYYDTHDTSAEMETGGWVEPQPMATTSLRLPVEVIDQLKRQAGARHIRYTSYVRSILERAAHGGTSPEIADITERLERIERAVTERQSPGDQKTALQTQADGWPRPGADRAPRPCVTAFRLAATWLASAVICGLAAKPGGLARQFDA